MSLDLSKNNQIKILDPHASVDAQYGPYSSKAAALAALEGWKTNGSIGLTVGVLDDSCESKIKEYWWNGTDLVLKHVGEIPTKKVDVSGSWGSTNGTNIAFTITLSDGFINTIQVTKDDTINATDLSNAISNLKTSQSNELTTTYVTDVTLTDGVISTSTQAADEKLDSAMVIANNTTPSTVAKNIPTSVAVVEYVNAKLGDLAGAMIYKGTCSAKPTVASPKTGWVYVVDTKHDTALVGDMYIYNGSNWDLVPSGNTLVLDNSATLSTTKTTLASVDGVNVTAKLPEASNSVKGVTTVGSAGGAAAYVHEHTNYKELQTEISDPTSAGSAISFIDSISLDTNGIITATKKSVLTVSNKLDGIVPKGTENTFLSCKEDGTVDWVDSPNTDTKVTSVDNHYVPDTGTNTSVTSGDVLPIDSYVPTTLELDAAGHVVSMSGGKLPSYAFTGNTVEGSFSYTTSDDPDIKTTINVLPERTEDEANYVLSCKDDLELYWRETNEWENAKVKYTSVLYDSKVKGCLALSDNALYAKLTGTLYSQSIHSQSISPIANNTYTLGGSSARWSKLYASGLDVTTTSTTTRTIQIASPLSKIEFNTGNLFIGGDRNVAIRAGNFEENGTLYSGLLQYRVDGGNNGDSCYYTMTCAGPHDDSTYLGPRDWKSLALGTSFTTSNPAAPHNVTVQGVVTATKFTETSDETLKDFIDDFNVTEDALAIPVKTFTWKDGHGGVELGTSALYILKICPYIVYKSPNGTLLLDYGKLSLISLLIIKLLDARIKDLETPWYQKLWKRLRCIFGNCRK